MPENPDLTKSLTGQASKFVRVKTDETGYEFATISGGGDLLAANNLSDLANAATARTNLGVATTANQTDSTNKRFVTDANLTVIGNTSGTNSGDNAVNSLYSGLAASKLDVPTGTPDGTKYLRDDNSWQPVSGGGGGLAQYQVRRITRR